MMRWLDQFRMLVRAIVWRSHADQELDREIQFHLEQQIEENLARGMTAEDARRSALHAIGGVTQIKELCRDMRGINWIENFISDLRYTLRGLRKAPGFTLAAILSLSLGIGANTAIFALTNAVFLNPLPVHEPSRVMEIDTIGHVAATGEAIRSTGISIPNYEDFRDTNRVFSGLVADITSGVTLTGRGAPKIEAVKLVSANYFDVLGVKPYLGRAFFPEEDRSPAPVAILSYSLWQAQSAGDQGVIGQIVELNSTPYTVIGVTPPEFKGTFTLASADVIWVPISMHQSALAGTLEPFFADRRARLANVFGRLNPGVSKEKAFANMQSIAAQLEHEYPVANRGRSVDLVPLSDAALGGVRDRAVRAAFALTVVVGFVLLIVCANLANLLLARSAKRAREIGVRIALGASRSRLIRQLLTESFLLAFAGGGGGLLVGSFCSRLLWFFRPPYLVWSVVPIRIDWHVLGFVAAVAIFSALLFGLVPALHAAAPDLNSIINGSNRTAGRSGSGAQRLLLSAQIALATVSLTCAGLFIRSMERAETFQAGFNVRNTFLFWLDLSSHHYRPKEGLEFLTSALELANRTHGVRSVAVASIPPLAAGLSLKAIPSGQPDGSGAGVITMVNTVSPPYFNTVQLPVREGRVFNRFDRAGAQRVAILSATAARAFWPGQEAIGRRFHFLNQNFDWEVVGIVGDITPIGGAAATDPMVYLPLDQDYQPVVALVVRAADNPASLVRSVMANVQPLDPNLALANEQTMPEIISRGLWAPRMGADLFGILGLLALGLAWMGTYALTAFMVTQRTREIGIRMTLGAQGPRVVSTIIRGTARMAAIGLIIGAVSALALTHFVASMLYGVEPSDPLAVAAAVALLSTAVVLAAYLPARRASRVDPMIALRHE